MIRLANASVERMASRLIKPNTLYHMAARGFSLFSFCGLSGLTGLYSISSSHLLVSISLSILPFTPRLMGFYPSDSSTGLNLIFSSAVLMEPVSPRLVSLSVENIFFSFWLCCVLLLLTRSEHQNRHHFILFPGLVTHLSIYLSPEC